jgi:F-type H+-transporting ATPase subunit b
MVLLRVDPGLVIWLWITFGIVLLILRLTVWDKIVGALDKRSERISSDLDAARKAKEKGADILAEYDAKIQEAKMEAARVIEQGRSEAARLKEDMLRQTQEEIRSQRARAQEEIARAREDAEFGVRDKIVSLSFTIANAILGRETGSSDNSAFADEFAAKLASGPRAGRN